MSAEPYTPPNSKGGGAMKWILIILVVLLILLGICIATCWFSSSWLFGMAMKPVNDTVEVLNENEELTEKLGKPIEQKGITEGGKFNVSSDANSGTELLFTIQGPKGEADVEGKVELFGQKWKPVFLTITFEDGSTMDVGEDVPAEDE